MAERPPLPKALQLAARRPQSLKEVARLKAAAIIDMRHGAITSGECNALHHLAEKCLLQVLGVDTASVKRRPRATALAKKVRSRGDIEGCLMALMDELADQAITPKSAEKVFILLRQYRRPIGREE